MIEEMSKLLATKPPHCRIVKWRLSYSEGLGLADEIAHLSYAKQQSPIDIFGSMMDGNVKILGIPVEMKPTEPGRAYPIEPRFIRYHQPAWLKAWMS